MSVKVVSCLSILTIFFAVVNIAAAVEVECPIIADTMFSGHEAEHNTNCGGQTWLRCKNFQGIVVFRFDMSKLEGYKVFGATLSAYCFSFYDLRSDLLSAPIFSDKNPFFNTRI